MPKTRGKDKTLLKKISHFFAGVFVITLQLLTLSAPLPTILLFLTPQLALQLGARLVQNLLAFLAVRQMLPLLTSWGISLCFSYSLNWKRKRRVELSEMLSSLPFCSLHFLFCTVSFFLFQYKVWEKERLAHHQVRGGGQLLTCHLRYQKVLGWPWVPQKLKFRELWACCKKLF